METIIRRVNNGFAVLSGIALIMLMFLIAAGVITRYIFSFSIPSAYEIVENYLMPITVFAALGYAYFSGIFPRVDALLERISSEKIKRIIESVMTFVEFLIFIFVTYHFFKLSLYSIETGMGFKTNGVNYPLYPIYLLLFIGFAWMTFLILYRLVQLVRNKKDPLRSEINEF